MTSRRCSLAVFECGAYQVWNHLDYVRLKHFLVAQLLIVIRSIKDVTHFTPLFAAKGDLMMDFSNIIAPEL
jgi:hypothetical protein